METYRKIPYWDYEVSDHGNVRSLKDGNVGRKAENGILAPFEFNGKMAVGLWKNGRQHIKFVHQLVWQAFYREFGIHIAHIDGDVTNNRLDNLIPEKKLNKIRKLDERTTSNGRSEIKRVLETILTAIG